MKFKARNGETVRITLKSGHVAIIRHDEWRELPDIFHAEAYAKGCLSENMASEFSSLEKASDGVDRQQLIREAVQAMLDDGNTDLFTEAGVPRTNKLSELLGFDVTAAERTAAFDAVRNLQ